MLQQSKASFRVECPDCDVTHEADAFHETKEYVEGHQEHTGHQMEWSHAEFDHVPDGEREWELNCRTCDRTWAFLTEDEANDFRDEHATSTDHRIQESPEARPLHLGREDLDPADHNAIRTLIADLDDHFTRGAPEDALFAHFGGDMTQIARVQLTIEQLERKSEVYRPLHGFDRTV